MEMKKVGAAVLVLAFAIAGMAFAGGGQDGSTEEKDGVGRWQDEYPRIIYSTTSGENEKDRIARVQHLIDYLERELDVEVEYYSVSDYAGSIEAMKAGKVDFSSFGTAGYVRAYLVTDGNVEPLVCGLDATGGSGYHSTIWVRADSGYDSVDDLKGKSLAFADPNSTSGFLVPSFYLRKAGKDPDDYFGTTGFSGNHEMGILAVVKGTYDAACTWYTNEDRGNPQRMGAKGMIDINDIKMIWKSPVITNGPVTARKDLPAQMKEDFRNALLAFSTKDPEGYAAMSAPSPPGGGYMAVNHDRYRDFVEMVKLNDASRRN